MLYTRSSFIKYLTKSHDCEIVNLNDDVQQRVLHIKNGPAKAYIHTTRKDMIDYREIYLVCRKLYLPLPGDSELEIIE